jgi:hypothetical protein
MGGLPAAPSRLRCIIRSKRITPDPLGMPMYIEHCLANGTVIDPSPLPCDGISDHDLPLFAQRSLRAYWAVVDGALQPKVKATRDLPLPTVMVIRDDRGIEITRWSTNDELHHV